MVIFEAGVVAVEVVVCEIVASCRRGLGINSRPLAEDASRLWSDYEGISGSPVGGFPGL